MASSAHGEGAVCCMCGDHGLADELFRCRCCRARLQHSYCSDLYPRAPVYRRCNWCLRAPAPAPDQQDERAAAAAADNNKAPEEKRKTMTASPLGEEQQRQRKRSRSPPSSDLGHHPVKKKHRAEEKTPQPQLAAAAEEIEVFSTGGGKGDKEVMRAGTTKARVSRVRVRRYKLLTEVISC